MDLKEIRLNNLKPFNTWDKEEHIKASIKGGKALQNKRRHARILKYELNIMLATSDLKKSVKSMHFRNGHITEDQIKIYKYYLKKLYHWKLNYYKLNNDIESIERLKDFYNHKNYKKQIKDAMQIIKNDIKGD